MEWLLLAGIIGIAYYFNQ